ncbi:hypothetical protein L248_3111 [Schleiferilactobacillus shenzhenensis LY-73]|uniref:Uncharacterized protein n=2 Tax=Schleiferilactobacillus shenzhenensis TaxID=1231337 RepID=U4TL80_9LACO|nr:hypothetical protein L248_3111 [Schleiferilactobacillus shenzhenensis LY-73]
MIKKAAQVREVKAKQRLAHSPQFTYRSENTYVTVPDTWAKLTDAYPAVISGLVTDWQRVTGTTNSAVTKLTIYVDKVLSGDTKLLGKEITVVYKGGYMTYGDYSYGRIKEWDKGNTSNISDSTLVFTEDSSAPLPKINSTILIPIRPFTDGKETPAFTKYIRENHLETAYAIGAPEYNTWIVQDGGHKVLSNNPEFQPSTQTRSRRSADSATDPLTKNLINLADELQKRLE